MMKKHWLKLTLSLTLIGRCPKIKTIHRPLQYKIEMDDEFDAIQKWNSIMVFRLIVMRCAIIQKWNCFIANIFFILFCSHFFQTVFSHSFRFDSSKKLFFCFMIVLMHTSRCVCKCGQFTERFVVFQISVFLQFLIFILVEMLMEFDKRNFHRIEFSVKCNDSKRKRCKWNAMKRRKNRNDSAIACATHSKCISLF